MATRGGKFQSAGETKTANRPEKCSQLIRRPGPFEQARRFLRGGNNESQVVLSDPLMLDLARAPPSRSGPGIAVLRARSGRQAPRDRSQAPRQGRLGPCSRDDPGPPRSPRQGRPQGPVRL